MAHPLRILSPSPVLHYVKDEDDLRLLAATVGPPLKELRLIVGLSVQKNKASEDGSAKESVVLRGERCKWQLFDKAEYLVRADNHEIVVCIGPDVEFFINNIARRREDMAFFKADRLKRFLTGTLFASSKKVTECAGKGKTHKWLLAEEVPASALALVAHVQPPSPFATPESLDAVHVGGEPSARSYGSAVPADKRRCL